MSAPDIETLYQIEEAVQSAVKDALVTLGVTESSVIVGQSLESLTCPCIQVWVQLGAANGHLISPPTLTYFVPDMWSIVISARVRTNRRDDQHTPQDGDPADQPTPDQHKVMRAKLRYMCGDIFAKVNTLLSYHALSEVRENGSQILVDEENNHDITDIQFAGVVGIKPDAWPAA